jgi:hypothetical protein
MDHQTFAQLLGNYGEFISSFAVLATLVILVVQVRGARSEISFQMVRELKRHNNEDIQLPLKDPRTLDVHIEAQRAFNNLHERDKIFWIVWLYSWITQSEDSWLAGRHGIIKHELINEQLEGVAMVLRSDGGRIVWPRIKIFFDPDYAAEVERVIAKDDRTWLDAMLGQTADLS